MSNFIAGYVSGPVVQARDIGELHVHLPRASLIPQQLPASPRPFVNRVDEIAKLDQHTAVENDAGASPVVLVTGGHGVGKSGTVRHWAHRNRSRYEDGQLYVDFAELRRDGAVDVSEVLSDLLQALGVDSGVVPARLADRSALFRSRLADRRVLVVLDDVRYAAEVKPLMPASASSCLLVTTRAPMSELLAEGARAVHVGPLDDFSAELLLCEMLGAARVTGEIEAITELRKLCAGLPVALRVCAGQLAGRHLHRSIGWFVERLADERRRLNDLGQARGQSLQMVFDEGYDALTDDEARLYRALGSQPVTAFTSPFAAFITGCSTEEAEDLIEGLAETYLLEPYGDRWRFHDLLRAHAWQKAEREDDREKRREVMARAVAFYVDEAARMDRAIIADRLRFATGENEALLGGFTGPAHALRWFETERPNLLAVLHAAHDHGFADPVWRLAEAMWIAYNNHKHLEEAREVYALGVEGAQASGRSDVEARMRQQLARGLMDLGDLDAAANELARAKQLAASTQERRLPASILEFQGLLAINRGDFEVARALLLQAREAFASIEYRRGVALQEYLIGRACTGAGNPEAALAHLREAENLIDPTSDAPTHGRILVRKGEALVAAREFSAAAAALLAAIEVLERADAMVYVASALETLAYVRRETGHVDQERRELEAALAVHESLGNPRADVVKARLATIAER